MNKFRLAILVTACVCAASCSSSPDVSPEALRAPFNDNKEQVQACYEKVQKKQPDLGTGTVELKFLINEDGKPYKTIFMKKRSTLSSKLLNACLKKVVHGWQFPTGKPLEVVYPFEFQKQGASNSGDGKGEEPRKESDLDVIDTSPPDEGSGDEGADDSATPTE